MSGGDSDYSVATLFQHYLAAHELGTIAAHADILHYIAAFAGPDKDPAQAPYLHPLLDEHLFFRLGDAIAHHPGGGASGSRTGGGIFAVVEDHAGSQPDLGIAGFAAHEVHELGVGLLEIGVGAFQFETK